MKLSPVVKRFVLSQLKKTALRAAAVYLVPSLLLFAYAAKDKYGSYGESLKAHGKQVLDIFRYGDLS